MLSPLILMVYRSSYRSRRGRGKYRRRRGMMRRSRYSKRHMTVGRVKRIIDAELKFKVLSVGPLTVPNLIGDFVSVTDNIAQGDSATERIGNWISPVNIHGSVLIQGNQLAQTTNTSVSFRVAFFQWKEDLQFQTPDAATIMQDTVAPFGPWNITNKGSFQVVWTRKFFVSNDDDNYFFTRKLDFYIRIGRRPKVLYDDGNPKKYHYFFFIMNDATDSTNLLQYFLDYTLRYTDS